MKNKKTLSRILVCLLAVVMILPIALTAYTTIVSGADPNFRPLEGIISTNKELYYDGTKIMRLPDAVPANQEISIIVEPGYAPLLAMYQAKKLDITFPEYALTEEAENVRQTLANKKDELLAVLDKAGLEYGVGADYSVLTVGFELTITAEDFEAVCRALGEKVNVVVCEVYEVEKSELVENPVKVDTTGIFDSSDFRYNGTGMVVAVLDTGLDYNHTAFSTKNLPEDKSLLGMKFEDVEKVISLTRASKLYAGLTAADVYVNEKVPYGFDYADSDPDIYPINSDHGTHVSGIIAGDDDVITGVAPYAQLVEMKTFSDIEQSARTSWILNALEDCAILGVDVINMSLGAGCGFSRESDKEQMSGAYDLLRAAGISLVVAAGNSYNSTYGSEKNGNLGLTSNPDSSTVGSPATYKGTLSVASIEGAMTAYMLYGQGNDETIIYFTEAANRAGKDRDFAGDLLGDKSELEIEYVVIPGAGRSADYTGIDVTGKIALVRRGDTTFEEKANVAQKKGAAGIIIYNNVSGEIKMTIGDATLPVCSIGQDDGELLAEAGSGTIRFAKSQVSGPFMSSFSSWGPTPDLRIKPEITAHGGSILSAFTGQRYERISGTSMACPNMAGVVALMRQYVEATFPELVNDPVELNAMTYRLLMSTASVVYNTNGLPYSVRKIGAGLGDLTRAATTPAYIITYDRETGEAMNTTKLELGDDPSKTGVYNMKFTVVNFGTSSLTYDIYAYVMTEGVSDTKTSHGETTVTQQGYILEGATVTATAGANLNGMTLTVPAGQSVDVNLTVTLSDADKKYMNDSFENGMYVEGFIRLDAKSGTEVDLGVPYLAFYGDWTVAPLFDLDYFETNKDELDIAIDVEDKNLPDAYATRPLGGMSEDYISYLGAYYFKQNPNDKIIAADRKYVSLSNQDEAINRVYGIWTGALRNASYVTITVTEDATGKVVYTHTEDMLRKSHGQGGKIYGSMIETDGFSAIDLGLKNNTAYTVTMKGYLDYGDGGVDTNLNNTFTFPLVTDFQAPVVTGVEFYTEPDYTNNTTRLFAKVAIYDNHYAMAAQFGYVGNETGSITLHGFDRYVTPVYSEFNSTSYVVYELTDYIEQLKNNTYNANTFTVTCYDYALNQSIYEIDLPDSYLDFYFAETDLTLSPNELYKLEPLAYPGTEWTELLEYYSTNEDVARVVGNELVAISAGETVIIARDPDTKKQTYINLKVLSEGDEGFKRYDKPVADDFVLVGFYVDRAYYQTSSDDRDISVTGDTLKFASQNSYNISLYPSEAVTLQYLLEAYFPETTEVRFESSNENIVTVTEKGKITGVAEGFASISVRVYMDGKATFYSKTINITVKNPYVTQGPWLMHYFGLGDVVELPARLQLTEIYQYAFSNYEYVPKDENDEISEEDPSRSKIVHIGDNTITEIIIPEGVEKIGPYAFAGLTKLKKVTLPSTLIHIDQSAFAGCTALEEIVGLENVKFINQRAFERTALKGTLNLTNAVAISDYAFSGCSKLESVTLGTDTRTIGAYAFSGAKKLSSISIQAEKIKLGAYAFQNCSALASIAVNASVIPSGTFSGCSSLEEIALGADVAVIGEYAFTGAPLTEFSVAAGNTAFRAGANGNYLVNLAGDTLVLVAPGMTGNFTLSDTNIKVIGSGAFSGASGITSVSIPSVVRVQAYAFAGCSRITSVSLGTLTEIGDYAFYGTGVTATPSFASLSEIGKYAFASTKLTSVTIPNNVKVGEGAFSECKSLRTVTVGDNVILGASAFALDPQKNKTTAQGSAYGQTVYYVSYTSALTSLTIGKNVEIGASAFYGASKLTSVTMGEGAVIGDMAFYNASSLTAVNGLDKATVIGARAFTGDMLNQYTDKSLTKKATTTNSYIYKYHAPQLTSLNLAAAVEIGEYAFAYCTGLKTVVLGEGITKIPAGAFYYNNSLTSCNLENITSVGDHAFYACALPAIEIPNVTEIGAYAFFYNIYAKELVLGEGLFVTVGEAAFAYCELMTEVENSTSLTAIGEYGFAYAGLSYIDLSGLVKLGGFAFGGGEVSDLTVVLGSSLTEIGENPFAFRRLAPFSTTVEEEFNGNTYSTTIYTYSLSETVEVIDGSLYIRIPTGLQLVTYAGDAKEFWVALGCTRISDYACAGTDIEKLYLNSELLSIGHMAFYGCENLVLVSFTSYKAPILEEQYNASYFNSAENFSCTGEFTFDLVDGGEVTFVGLGIVPYYLWNVTGNPSAVFYGATFVDYIGHETGHLIMVRPSNGQNYETFVLDQYFTTSVSGALAADSVTLEAIAAIDRLPERVQLTDRDLVKAAREAYDRIATLEQQSLVTNYQKLTAAEKRISDLDYLENGGAGNDEPQPTPNDGISGETVALIILGILLGIAAVSAAVFGVLYFKNRYVPTPENATEETDPTPVGGDVLDAPSVTEENTVEETSATEEIGGEN